MNRVFSHVSARHMTSTLESIGWELDAQFPDDPVTLTASRDHGLPAVVQSPRSNYARAIDRLARQLDVPEFEHFGIGAADTQPAARRSTA